MKKTPDFRVHPIARAARAALISLLASSISLGHAAIQISQTPPVQRSTSEPTPNIILTLDDSGSMDASAIIDGKRITRMEALKQSVANAFQPYNNGEFRLAYQKLSDLSTYPSRKAFSTLDSLMKPFAGKHKENFEKWNKSLTANSRTPLRFAQISAGLYTAGYKDITIQDAYSDTPAYHATPILGGSNLPKTYNYHDKTYQYDPLEGLDCRRTVHILMTDGDWNDYPTAFNNIPGAALASPNYAAQEASHADAQLPKRVPLLSGLTASTRNAPTTPYTLSLAQNNSGEIYPSVKDKTYASKTPLADLAFSYWATDLRPDLDDNIKPVIKQLGDEVISQRSTNGTVTGSKTVPEWWNPKNNPATWQNLQTYTVGFGDVASLDELLRVDAKGQAVGGYYSDPKDYMYKGDFYSNLIGGTRNWRTHYANARYDLWHAAYNGRGKFYAAQSGDALKSAFVDILATITADSSSKADVKTSGSSSNLTGDTMVYISKYDAKNNSWTGQIDFWRTGDWGKDGASPKATSSIPTAGNRTILTFIDNEGEAFTWKEIKDLDDKSSPKRTDVNLSQEQVNAMRGKPLGDIVNSGLALVGKPTGGLYKGKDYRYFADAIKSRTHMVYAGANDGMLHGFDAGASTPSNPGTGVEKIAYIPRGILPRLQHYLHRDYEHQYFVDGALFSGDAQIEEMADESGAGKLNGWRTVLVGSLGAGGKGYYVLDVTNPSKFSEKNADDIVLVDQTAGTDADIGQQIGAHSTTSTDVTKSAQIVQINLPSTKNKDRKQWAVIMGNGINSENGRPVLLVQSLEGNKTLYKIDACGSGTATSMCDARPAATASNDSNGLSAPTPIDLNGDGTADVVYAGDLQGNMWKFDISSSNATRWSVGLGGHPLFTAQGLPTRTQSDPATAYRQAITAAPLVLPHPNGGLMVAFGTGRNLNMNDAADHNAASLDRHGNRLNSFYGIRDLQKFSFTDTGDVSLDTSTAAPVNSQVRAAGSGSRFAALHWQSNPAMEQDATHRVFKGTTSSSKIASNSLGWYIDFPEIRNDNAAKVLETPVLARDNVVQFFSTNVASEHREGDTSQPEVCGVSQNYSGARYVFNLLNVFTGENPNLPVWIAGFDINAGKPAKANRIEIEGSSPPVHSGPGKFRDATGEKGGEFPRFPGKFVGWRIIK